MLRVYAVLCACVAMLAVMGCEDSEGSHEDTTSPADTTAPVDSQVADSTVGVDTIDATDTTPDNGCDYNGWAPEGPSEGYSFSTNGGSIFYDSYSGPMDQPTEVIGIGIWYGKGGSSVPHAHDFTFEIADAHTTLSGGRECPDAYTACAKRFRALGGTLEITENGDRLKGTIRDIVMREVVPGSDPEVIADVGEVWCIDSYSFDAAVVELF